MKNMQQTAARKGRRCLTIFLLLILPLTFMWQVAAAGGTEALYTVSQEDNTIFLQKDGEELTFWEAPTVTAGQSQSGGTLTLRNDTEETLSLWLDEVVLPYDNEAALRYLDYVSVDISEGDTTYYHGTLSRIMENSRQVKLEDVAPGEERVLSMSISCAYTYEGDVPSFASLIWQFNTSVEKETTTSPALDDRTPGSGEGIMLAVKVAGGILGGCILIGLVVVLLSVRRSSASRHGKR